ncbi:MAG TPA: MMPL family transporter [Candidatus Dormibacteraeota bacterium]|nr:MMPL family transporter [Candidatus Dormibacteraeota bacterium]
MARTSAAAPLTAGQDGGSVLRRLAGPMARRPLVFLLVALLVCAAAATGFVRFGIDAGQSLLVGANSAAGQANQSFTQSFGTDPIVVVLSAGTRDNPANPTAPYLEKNLQRLAALEDDLAHDPRVADVLGPGSVAHSALAATTEEITRTLGDSQTLGEYPYFVAETDYLVSRQKGVTDTTKLSTQFQSDLTNAKNLLELYVARAANDAHQARAAYAQKPIPSQDRIIDGAERAADAAVAADPLPPLFAQYLAGPGNTPDQTVARDFFDRLTSAFGDCDSAVASLLQITPSCQVYLDRILLDLPNCPTQAQVTAAEAKGSEVFCSPKREWAAVMPPPETVTVVNPASHATQTKLLAREVITVRLTAAAAASRSSVLAVRQKIADELSKGIATDAYTRTFTASQLQQLQQLGPLDPTECAGAGQQNSPSCYSAYSDHPFESVIAGAPLLTYGVVDSMTETLLILLPVVIVLMALLLMASFRVRGRLWPLLAAAGAGAGTIGMSLWFGIPVTPAVLAGIPVLVGLAVDYAVQLVARYDEERGRGADREAALAEALGRSGPATLTAAVATLAGLGTLLVFAGVDAGPLVAVPLVAEFALVLFVGVILAWLAAAFVALPAAALREPGTASSRHPAGTVAVPHRTLGLATYWRGAVVPAVIAALIGWALLPHVPVQTQVDQLLAASLPQLTDINTVRDQTGYGNEIDIYVHGQVAGPYNQPGTPANVVWQCSTSEAIRSVHADQVALAISIADFFIATSSASTASTNAPCVAPAATAPSPSPSPSASPGATSTPSPTPSATAAATPTRYRPAPSRIYLAASAVASQTASATPASSTPTPAPAATPGPAPAQQKIETAFLCDLRLLPSLARNLVQDIPLPPSNTNSKGTLPCPPLDKYLNTWLTPDSSPIDPSSARIVIGVQSTSIADEARLIDSIRANEIASPPNGITAAPAGIAALAAQAYDNIVSRSLVLNLLPLVVVFLALLLLERDFRRAALPILPTAIAAGWAPLILLLLGLLPGSVGTTLGSFNPLTVVLGALVIALATEFGVVLLRRFDEEMARGVHPDDAAAAALAATGRAIRVSALTLGAGFAVLAVSAFFPNGLPLLGAFGFTVLIDLGLAVAAVFGIMLPVAVAIERSRYAPAPAMATEAPRPRSTPVRTAPAVDAAAPAGVAEAVTLEKQAGAVAVPPGGAGRRRGVSGRRRPPTTPTEPAATEPPRQTPRRPGVSGRRRKGPGPGPRGG